MNRAEASVAVELPHEAQIEVVGLGRSPPFMTFENFCRLLAQFPAVERLRLVGGGDPLAHPRIFGMVREASGRGIAVTVATRLEALSARAAEDCVTSGLACLEIALEPRAEGRVARALQRLNETCRRLGKDVPEVRLATDRAEHLPALLRFAGAQGIAAVRLLHPRRRARARPPLGAEAQAQAQRLAADLGVRLELPAATRCDAPWRSAHVGFYGRARPCAMVTALDRVSLGNMLRDGVVRVWTGEDYRAFRERLASPEPPEVCRGCAAL